MEQKILFKEGDTVCWIDDNNKGRTGKVITCYVSTFPYVAYGILRDDGIYNVIEQGKLCLEEEVQLKIAE